MTFTLGLRPRLLRILLLFALLNLLVSAASVNLEERDSLVERQGQSSAWWLANIKRQGTIAYGKNSTYKLYRNVKDFGAKGDGVTDDTAAINRAVADSNRCGPGCDSSTTQPALVYFPPGTYMLNSPILMHYYTQMVGDYVSMPVIKALPTFFGIGLFDSDVYYPGGANWYQNQNNFYRQVRNFILDITLMPFSRGSCIHWQVAQATSLENIVFNMRTDGGTENKQQGIFMDNGSGGWMADLIFNGGNIGFFLGNQQFTSRNLTFNNCNTAVFMNWVWVWAFKSIKVNNCKIGIAIIQGGGTIQTVGSTLVQDAVFNNVDVGIMTTFSSNSTPVAGGTVVVDNVDFTGARVAVGYPNGTVILPGGSKIQSWIQGRSYTARDCATQVGNLTCYIPCAASERVQKLAAPPPKPTGLLTPSGTFFERSKPQYGDTPLASVISVKDRGAVGDGLTDDTDAIESAINSIAGDMTKLLYFDHGAYLISRTILIPKNIRMTGEAWPLIMANGASPKFQDMNNPVPVFRVGNPGDIGSVEMSELVFETRGACPGAILLEWNLREACQGCAGTWDVHFRIGGTAGTLLQSDRCTDTRKQLTTPDPKCIGTFMLMHVTKHASLYMENNWGWVSDHELDAVHNNINIWNGRGILIESVLPVWMYGQSWEHCMLYNYNIVNAQQVYATTLQSETAYMQGNPNALVPFPPDDRYFDPTFEDCFRVTCYKTIALRIYNSNYILIYGTGFYSFFDNYDSGCLITNTCQEHIIKLEKSEAVYIYGLNTLASENMVTIDGVAAVPHGPNLDTFCQGIAVFEYP